MGEEIRKENVSSFDTNDFDLAAYLLFKGCEFICAHPTKHGMIYHFAISDTTKKVAEEYWNSKKQDYLKQPKVATKGVTGN